MGAARGVSSAASPGKEREDPNIEPVILYERPRDADASFAAPLAECVGPAAKDGSRRLHVPELCRSDRLSWAAVRLVPSGLQPGGANTYPRALLSEVARRTSRASATSS